MIFTGSDRPIDRDEVLRCAAECGLSFPRSLVDFYLVHNGGVPEPCVFEGALLDTVVCEMMPLISSRGGTSVQTYLALMVERRMVPSNYFPFAVDGGGDYFFLDTSCEDGYVYFFAAIPARTRNC